MAQLPEPPPAQQTKGDRAADKARRKAERPWYKKKRFMIPLVLLVLIVIGGMLGGEEAAEVATDETGQDDPSESADTDGDTVDDALAEAPEDAPEDDAPEEAPEDVPDEASADAEHATIGEPVRDGQFEFVVTGFECGIQTLGSDFTETEASGQFCVLDLTVQNIGESAQAMFADNQYLFDAQDRRFNASFEGSLAVDSPIFEEINPGNTVEGRVPFDVPADASIEFAELHDSAFSGGVLVDLTP